MRKKTFLRPLLWAIIFILFSCKKENLKEEESQTPLYENLIPKIKSWLDEQKNGMSTASKAKIDELKMGLKYEEIRLEKYKDSKEFIIVPVAALFKSANNSDKNPTSYLVLQFDNQESITRGNIIQYISSNSQKAAPKNTFHKIFNYEDLDCSGQFTILGITDDFEYGLRFENGKLRSVTELKKKTHPNDASGRLNVCIDWYEQTWYYWPDGTVEFVSEVYAFTTCGDCAQPRIANGGSLRVNCEISTGGGGTSIEYEYVVSKPLIWKVQDGVNWRVHSYESVSGVKKASEPQGGHFTSIVHEDSYLSYDLYKYYTWQELGNTPSLDDPQTITIYVTGKLTRTSTDEFNIYNEHTTRSFATMFP